VTTLDFLSPDLATPDVAAAQGAWRSPLERALRVAPPEVADVSVTGKLEIRGDVGTLKSRALEIVPITPERTLVLCDFTKTGEIRAKLSERFIVVDMSAGLAGLQVRGEAIMRRLTDLDLDSFPAAGAVAHVQAYVLRDGGDVFRIFFPQEYGHYLAEVVVDAAEGARR
jgi:sarcosine oxidase gamma subunit